VKILSYRKDGGMLSHVWGLFLIEIKSLFSVVLLNFKDGSREAYHTHAFNAWSFVLKGRLEEHLLCACGDEHPADNVYTPSFRRIFTDRDAFHKVVSVGSTWVLSFRGPWRDIWAEYLPEEKRYVLLTHGRKEVPFR
jgi:hypothetical protein